jgi:protein involved in polysaccharide export with SLBB domain
MNRQSFTHRFAMKFGQFVFAVTLTATVAGAVRVCAQTPSASVRGGSTRVSRGGPLASAASFSFTSLKSEGVRGNDPAASTQRVQRSWGGASAPASRTCFLSEYSQDKQPTAATVPAADDVQVFELLYENFRRTYRLGPADEIAVRVRLEPDYSIERAKISPDGRVFHPLLGDVVVGGLTVEQLIKKLRQDLSRYIKEPEVSVQLLEAKSAKIGVLGEVSRPGIFIMSEPLTVLDAITMAGGFARTGSRSNVTLVRQGRNGRYQNLVVDVKKLLAGKADVEENLPLQPGDTVIVHGNFLKKLEYVTTLAGFTQFLTFVALSR